LVDDHILFREGLRRLLDAESGFEVAGQCGSVKDALDLSKQMQPDLVLLDFDLGDQRGSEFLARARETGFAGRVLVVTAGMTDTETLHLLEQGIAGIVYKHSPLKELAEAIRRITSGETWVDQRAVKAVVRAAVKARESDGNSAAFTERERQVLRGVFTGLANKEIADELKISEASVKASIQQLFRKTGVRTRSQLVRVALEHKDW